MRTVMAWWDRRAHALQRVVRNDEEEQVPYFDDEKEKQAVVHTRQDIILIVSHLSSVNSQLAILIWIVAAILLVAIYVAWHMH
jgi:hypothetical protein